MEKPPFTKKKKKKKKKKRRANNNNDDDDNEMNRETTRTTAATTRGKVHVVRAHSSVGVFSRGNAHAREREKAFSIRYMSLIPSKRVSITNNEGKKRLRH